MSADRVLADLKRLAAKAKGPADAPGGPDADLIERCHKVLELRVVAECERKNWYAAPLESAERAAALRRRKQAKNTAQRLMARIAREPVTTPAALYAKCAVLRESHGYAGSLAFSVAEAILKDGRLRRVLWPAEVA